MRLQIENQLCACRKERELDLPDCEYDERRFIAMISRCSIFVLCGVDSGRKTDCGPASEFNDVMEDFDKIRGKEGPSRPRRGDSHMLASSDHAVLILGRRD